MLSPDTVARIRACRGVYSMGDTSRHFKVSKTTVRDIWLNKRHKAVRAAETPNVATTRKDVTDDLPLFIGSGRSVAEISEELNIPRSTLYEQIRRAGYEPAYFQ